MSQFDVYLNTGKERKQIPYVVDIQCDIVKSGTRVVVPLISAEVARERNMDIIEKLNPVLMFGNTELILAMHLIAGVSERNLREKVGSMSHLRDEIARAFDVMVSGV